MPRRGKDDGSSGNHYRRFKFAVVLGPLGRLINTAGIKDEKSSG